MKRREFIQLISAAVLPLSAMHGQASALSRYRLPLHFVRSSSLSASGAELSDIAERVDVCHSIGTDVTRLWSDQLEPLWRDEAVITAGLTRHAEYFVLRTLSRPHGYTSVCERDLGEYVSWRIEPESWRCRS